MHLLKSADASDDLTQRLVCNALAKTQTASSDPRCGLREPWRCSPNLPAADLWSDVDWRAAHHQPTSKPGPSLGTRLKSNHFNSSVCTEKNNVLFKRMTQPRTSQSRKTGGTVDTDPLLCSYLCDFNLKSLPWFITFLLVKANYNTLINVKTNRSITFGCPSYRAVTSYTYMYKNIHRGRISTSFHCSGLVLQSNLLPCNPLL